MRGRRRPFTICLVAAALLSACSSGGGKQSAPTTTTVGAVARPTKPPRICADVGIVKAPTGSTAELALAAFVATFGSDSKDWVLAGGGTSGDSVATYDAAVINQGGYASLDVRSRGGVWTVDGACVGKPYPDVTQTSDAK